MRVRAKSTSASWLGIAMLTFMSTTGCEIISEVDRSQIDDGNGGAPPTTSSSSSSSSSSGSMAECTPETVDMDCPDPMNECVVRTCSTEGKCETMPVAAGTALAMQTTGDCKTEVCDGNGATTTQDEDTDLPNDGNDCTTDSCSAGQPTYTSVAINTACGAGGALFCDGQGACVGCTDDTQCGMPTECSTPVCDSAAHTCTTNFIPVGTATTNQTAGDCQEEQCDGIGGTKLVSDTNDIADDNNACTADSCNGATPTHTNEPVGFACTDGGAGAFCNGAGACVECLTGADCSSSVCVAQACAAPTCTDGVMNDVETDVDCGGGTCSPCSNGLKCNGDTDCVSDVCGNNVCVASVCGDNRITGAETCDDGGIAAGDGCSATCGIETGWECTGVPSTCALSCGDNTLDPGETCDDGGTAAGDGCSATCGIEAGWECTGVPSTCALSCGDNTLDPGETCDDGGTASGDGCSATCAVEPGYSCTGVPSVCALTCGDGTIDAGETCDDNNTVDDDGCSSNCATETGWDCTGTPSVCATVCGDGIIAGAEVCDDNNTNSGDCCSSTCGTEAGCEIEPNDNDTTANPVTTVFVADKVKAFINPSFDYDYFTFDVPAGMVGSVALTSMDGPLGSTCSSLTVDTNITLYDSSFAVLGVNDDISGADYCSQLAVPGLAPGTYYIEVTSSPFIPDATFDYSLEAIVTIAPPVDECAMGTDDCVAAATCTDTLASYTCTCPPGTGGDGLSTGSGCATGLYYAFDGTGTSVPNLAVTPPLNAPNATIVGAPTQGGTGKCGTALVGSGGGSNVDHVNTNWVTNLTDSWTISMWINNYAATTALAYLFGDITAGTFRCFGGGIAGNNNVLLRGTGMTEVLVTGGANGSPAMITFVYDSTLNDIKAYLNGALVNTVVQGGPLSFVGTGSLAVGALGGGSATNLGLPANALMDEFRLYHRALTATEVGNLFSSPTCTP